MENGKWTEDEEVKPITAYTKGFVIQMDHKVYDNIFGWCKAASPIECSGMGLIERDGSVFRVTEAFLPEQRGTPVSTVITPNGRDSMIRDLAKRKVSGKTLKFWWHTHPDFNAYFSSTDVENIERLVGWNGDYMLSMVVNKMGEYNCRLDVMNPIRLAVEHLPVVVDYPEAQGTRQHQRDVEKMVTEVSLTQRVVSSLVPAFGKDGGYLWKDGKITERSTLAELERREGVISDE